MSVEAPVMGVEQSGGVVWSMIYVNLGRRLRSMERPKRARSRKAETDKVDLQRRGTPA